MKESNFGLCSVICVIIDFCLQEINVKANDVHKVAKNAFGKYMYS